MASKTSFNFGFLQPNEPASGSLSTGIYSLSARSNVPFARLIGKGIDKIFTWGETVEVPKGEICTVRNASFHAGDLFINSGCDLDNRPARITIPVPFTETTTFADSSWRTGSYPVDVRMARRAYLAIDASVDAEEDDFTLYITGQRLDGSHNTQDQIVPLGVTGAGYVESFTFIAGLPFGLIPLGKLSMIGDDTRPHTLLTIATIYIPETMVFPGTTPTAYYTVEY